MGRACKALASEATSIQLVAYLDRPAALTSRAPDFESEAPWWKIAQHFEGHRFEAIARLRQQAGPFALRQHFTGGFELTAGFASSRRLAQPSCYVGMAYRIGPEVMLKTGLRRIVENKLSGTPANRATERGAARIQPVQPSTKPNEPLTGLADDIDASEHRPKLAE